MDVYHVFGYAGALLTGLILGLLGGGGAMLSIPVLVYLFKIEASVATGYSLFLIGVTALSGALQNVRKQQVDYKAIAYYGLPSTITIYCVRRFLMPNLPDQVFSIGSYVIDKNHLILLIFSIVMFGAAYRMLKSNGNQAEEQHPVNYAKLMLYSVFIGAFLGFVGAGGGFLIIPALVYFANLPMKKAIGTSLVLVAVNSFIGFMGDVHTDTHIDWQFLFVFLGFSVAGILAGTYLTNFIDGNRLKKAFGWFILVVGVYIVIKEMFF